MIYFDKDNDIILMNAPNILYGTDVDCNEIIWKTALEENGFKTHSENWTLHLSIGNKNIPILYPGRGISTSRIKNPNIFIIADILQYTQQEIIISLCGQKSNYPFLEIIDLFYENMECLDLNKIVFFI